MATWASRRKFVYGGSVFLAILLIAGAVFFSLFYKAPTCNDGLKNGDELGVDCGGSCLKICQSAYLSPKIEWGGAKFEKVADGLYNIAAYLVNPNTDAAAENVPFKLSLFDNKGALILEKEGIVTLPAHRNTLAFIPAIDVGKRVPAKATFEFTQAPVWFKSHDTLGGISVVDKKYNEDEKNSTLEVTLKNNSLNPYENVGVGVVLYDIDGNTIGFSKTMIDSVGPKGGTEIAPFTWPLARQNRVVTIEALPVIAPLHDRL